MEEEKRIEETYLQQQVEQKAKQEAEEKAQVSKRNIVVKGVELNDEQEKTLKDGGHIFLKNMTAKDGKTLLSAYVFLDDEKK